MRMCSALRQAAVMVHRSLEECKRGPPSHDPVSILRVSRVKLIIDQAPRHYR